MARLVKPGLNQGKPGSGRGLPQEVAIFCRWERGRLTRAPSGIGSENL